MLESLLDTFSVLLRVFIGIFCLGMCVFVHELGHFLAARKRGLVVSRFSIGFGPRIWGWTKDGVDYRLSLIPFGGYVALPQLADMGSLEGDEEAIESFGNESKEQPKISYTDKMIVSVMGAVLNVIFAFGLSLMLWVAGQDVSLSLMQTKVSVMKTMTDEEGNEIATPASLAGLKTGDAITHIDGVAVNDWGDLSSRIVTGVKRTEDGKPLTQLTVDRNGEELQINVLPVLATKEDMRRIGVTPIRMLEASEKIDKALASKVMPGDKVAAINGVKYFGLTDFPTLLGIREDSTALITFERDGVLTDVSIPYKTVEGENGGYYYDFAVQLWPQGETIYPNPLSQFTDKMELMYLTLRGLLHKGSDVKVRNMSGPVGIIDNFQESVRYGPKQLAWLLVFVNINLAIMNLMPIPVLDGGHMTFATIAKIRGRPLPRKFMENLQVAFAMLLFSTIIYITFFDVGRVLDKIGL